MWAGLLYVVLPRVWQIVRWWLDTAVYVVRGRCKEDGPAPHVIKWGDGEYEYNPATEPRPVHEKDYWIKAEQALADRFEENKWWIDQQQDRQDAWWARQEEKAHLRSEARQAFDMLERDRDQIEAYFSKAEYDVDTSNMGNFDRHMNKLGRLRERYKKKHGYDPYEFYGYEAGSL